MRNKVTSLIAVRSGSKRAPRKNIRPFGDTSLLEIKIRQAMRIGSIDEVVVSSDDTVMLDLCRSLGATPHERDPHYASDTVPMGDVYSYLAKELDTEHVVWMPVTSPLVEDKTVEKCIEVYQKGQHDSVVTVHSVREYLWQDGVSINYDSKNHPRSQDLPNIYALNFAVNVLSKKLMIEKRNIIGDNHYPYMLEGFETVDIDDEKDFLLAEILYKMEKSSANS